MILFSRMSTLALEVVKFRRWAERRHQPDYAGPRDHADPEWECDYPDWPALYAASETFLASAADRALTGAELEFLLYALARDNEDERILDTLERFSGAAMQVAETALSYADADARWQAAVLAGRVGTPEAAALVRRFLTDDVEYVRRRAGFALQKMEARK